LPVDVIERWKATGPGWQTRMAERLRKFGDGAIGCARHNLRMTPLVPLIELLRGGTPESVHFGAVAVADAQGKVLARAGDPHRITFTRSTLKALQALPFMQAGGPKAMGFSQENLAMMCASHSGEPMHVAQVQGMLDKAGLTYKTLQCGCHVPIFADLGVAPKPGPGQYDERHHNCSGKHAGFLAHCVQQGWPVGNYLAPDHPLQQAIRREVARAVGLALRGPEDGHRRLLGAQLRDAAGQPGPRLCAAGERLVRPGVRRELRAARRRDDVSSRVGVRHRAQRSGLHARRPRRLGQQGRSRRCAGLASRSRSQAFALKIADGNSTALNAATVAVLDQLGLARCAPA
jgi:L-asparaginase II